MRSALACDFDIESIKKNIIYQLSTYGILQFNCSQFMLPYLILRIRKFNMSYSAVLRSCVIAVCTASIYTSWSLLVMLYPALAQEHNVSYGVIGIVLGVLPIVSVLVNPLFDWYLYRFNTGVLVGNGVLINGIVLLTMGYFDNTMNMYLFITASVFLQLVGAFSTVLMNFKFYSMGFGCYIGTVLGPIIGGVLLESGSINTTENIKDVTAHPILQATNHSDRQETPKEDLTLPFTTMGQIMVVVAIVSILILVFIGDNHEKINVGMHTQLKDILNFPHIVVLMGNLFLTSIGLGVICCLLQKYLLSFGLTQIQTGCILSSFIIIIALSSVLFQFISKWLKSLIIVAFGSSMLIIASVIMLGPVPFPSADLSIHCPIMVICTLGIGFGAKLASTSISLSEAYSELVLMGDFGRLKNIIFSIGLSLGCIIAGILLDMYDFNATSILLTTVESSSLVSVGSYFVYTVYPRRTGYTQIPDEEISLQWLSTPVIKKNGIAYGIAFF